MENPHGRSYNLAVLSAGASLIRLRTSSNLYQCPLVFGISHIPRTISIYCSISYIIYQILDTIYQIVYIIYIHIICSTIPGPLQPAAAPTSVLLHDALGAETLPPGFKAQRALNRSPKDHINMRILQAMVSGIPLYGALKPECEILMFTWSLGALLKVKENPQGARELGML